MADRSAALSQFSLVRVCVWVGGCVCVCSHTVHAYVVGVGVSGKGVLHFHCRMRHCGHVLMVVLPLPALPPSPTHSLTHPLPPPPPPPPRPRVSWTAAKSGWPSSGGRRAPRCAAALVSANASLLFPYGLPPPFPSSLHPHDAREKATVTHTCMCDCAPTITRTSRPLCVLCIIMYAGIYIIHNINIYRIHRRTRSPRRSAM